MKKNVCINGRVAFHVEVGQNATVFGDEEARTNVLELTVDTVRFNSYGCGGYHFVNL